MNADGEDVTASYDITYANGTLEVTKKAITITADSDTKVYDGTPLAKDNYTSTALATGDSIESVTVTGSQTFVGSSDNVPSAVKIVNADGEDITANYEITYASGTLEVTRKAVTVTADSDVKVYDGTALMKDSYTSTALATGDSIESATVVGSQTVVGSSDNVPSAAKIVNADGEDVTASYEITYANGTLEVTKRPLTITAKSATRQYNAMLLEEAGYTNTALAVGDAIESVTVIGSRLLVGTSDNVPSAVVIVNAAGENVTDNYAITYVNGTLQVTQYQSLIITADSGNKEYDGTALEVGTYQVSGLQEGDSIASVIVTGTQTTVGTGDNIPSDAKVVNSSGEDVTGSYEIVYQPGTLTVSPRPLTITAGSESKTYDGTELVGDSYTFSDLASGDRMASVKVTGSRTDVGENDNVPSDAVILNAADENVTESYSINYVNGKLTVTSAQAVIHVASLEKEYGDGDPVLTFTVTGLKGEDTDSVITCTLSRVEGENVGDYAITATYDDALQGNYEIASAEPGTLTIIPATATVTADGKTKVYGAEDPALTATVSGLKNGDAESLITYTLSRDEGEDVGEYDIIPEGDEQQGNYRVAFVPGTFTITRNKVIVTANDLNKVYGEDDPEFTATITGLKIGDDENSISFTFERAAGENVGEYTVTPFGEATQGNYDVEFKEGKLTIARATATVKAEAQSKVYGTEDPELTVEITGLQNGDEESVITYAVTREEGDDVGEYIITPSGEAVQGNYNVVYETSKLTITPASVTVTANANEKVYGSADPTLTAEIEGLMPGESEELIAYTLTRVEGEGVSDYAITVAGKETQGNYRVSYVPGTFTITRRAVTVTVTGHSATTVYDGQPHFVTGYDIEITDEDEGTVMDESYSYKEQYVKFDDNAEAETDPLIVVGEEHMFLTSELFSNTNENYAVTFNVVDGYQIITPSPITVIVTGNHAEVNYDGTVHTVSGYVVATEDELYDLSNVSYSDEAVATRTESGTSYMGLDAKKFANNDENFTVSFTVTDGYITINPIEISVVITGNTSENAYDSTEHTVSGYTVSSTSNLFDSEKLIFIGTAEASRTEITLDEEGQTVDTTYMGLSAEDFGYNDNNVTAVFTVNDGWQKITPITAEVAIVGNNNISDYDGAAHTITGYTATAEPALYDVDSDIVFTGEASATQMNAGTKYMELDADQFSNKNPNFETVTFIVSEDGYQTIRPITVTVTIVGNNNEETPYAYDGQEHSITGFTASADTPLYHVEDDEEAGTTKDFTFNGAASAARTDAGRTQMNLAAEQFENKNSNFSSVIFEIEDGFVDIAPISVTVSIAGHTGVFTYDRTKHTVEGYDATYSTDLYDENCFELISTNSDCVSRTEAGTSEMNLGPDSFRNLSPNFDDVTFEVTDGSITINPAIVVSKYLNNVSAAEAETFTFNVALTNEEGETAEPISGHILITGETEEDNITTDEEGKASFTIAVAGMRTTSVTLDIPYGASLRVEEDKTDDPNNYITTVNGETGAASDLNFITDSTVTLTFENAIGNICRIGEDEFQTIASAVAWAQMNNERDVTIEMMVDYTMPVTDVVTIPAGYSVTLSTASDYEGEGAATITRATGFIGPMFTNRGTLNIADSYEATKIIIDGNGENVEAQSAVIENSGTLNVCAGGTVRNANSTGNGGAIYATGPVNITGGSLANNHAQNGGAIYSTVAVAVSSGTITGNTATTNGGAIYMAGGIVTISEEGVISNNLATNGGGVYLENSDMQMSGGAMRGNKADDTNGLGGAICNASGTVSISGGTIGGESDEEANTAWNGAAVYVGSGIVNAFSGGRITGNITMSDAGGAVGIPSDNGTSVKLNFSGSAYIYNNTQSNGAAANVCLSADTDTVINALSLNEEEDDAPRIGIFVPGEGTLYANRGISKSIFGGYATETNVDAFINDRSPNMMVSMENFKLIWGKAIAVEVRYLSSFSLDSLPPTATGTIKITEETYYPATQQNYIADLAADVLATHPGHGIDSAAAFACAYVEGHAAQFSDYITKIVWDSSVGNWSAERKNPSGPESDTLQNVEKVTIYYVLPAYITINNNADLTSDNPTGSPLTIRGLTVNGIDAASDDYLGYGLIVAQNGATVAHFEPLKRENLTMQAGVSYTILFPGARNKAYSLRGQYEGRTFENGVHYDNRYNGDSASGDYDAASASAGFETTGVTFGNNDSVEILYGTADNICKIVDSTGIPHYYSSFTAATGEALKEENYSTYCVDGVVTIEMLKDYLIPGSDQLAIPDGKHFKLTTAAEYEPTAYERPENAKASHDCSRSAKISRAQTEGKGNSFIIVNGSTVGTGRVPTTALDIENIRFDGKQAGSTNGGVLNAQNCAVTIKNIECVNFEATDGGAIYVGVPADTGDCSTLTVEDSWFADNRATGANGQGGGAIWTGALTFTLTNNVFERCSGIQKLNNGTDGTQATQGGAVFQRIKSTNENRAYSSASITGCDFLNCKAYGAGGGMELDSYRIQMTDCNFNECYVLTSEKEKGGGAFNVYLDRGNVAGDDIPEGAECWLRLNGCKFIGCTANQVGGAFRTQTKSTIQTAGFAFETTLTNTTFDGNIAGKSGGALWLNINQTTLTLDGCTIKNNQASESGGAVHSKYPVTICGHTTITNNLLTTNSPASGAAIYYINTLTLGKAGSGSDNDVIIIKDNKAGSGQDSRDSNLWINNSYKPLVVNHLGGTYDGVHGEIHVSNDSNPNAAAGVQFANDTMTEGGTIFTGLSDANHVFVSDVDSELWGITDRSDRTKIIWRGKPICKITDAVGNLLYMDAYGADPAVFDALDDGTNNINCNSAFATIRDRRLKTDNFKYKLYWADGSVYTDTVYQVKLLVENCPLKVRITTPIVQKTMSNKENYCKIILTTAGESDTLYPYTGTNGTYSTITRDTTLSGDMIYAQMDLTIDHITIDGGCGESGNLVAPTGGRIIHAYNGKGTTVELGEQGVLQNYHSIAVGAAVYVEWGDFKLNGGTIQNCISNDNGGAIYMNSQYKGTNTNSDPIRGLMTFVEGEVVNCRAKNGGGVYIANGKFVFAGGSITNCTASEKGGGVYHAANQTTQLIEMSDATISNNNAGDAGGGIIFGSANARIYFSGDAVIDGNTKGSGNSAEKCNLELNQNSSQVINTTGLGEDAMIGVYVPDTSNYYNTYGIEGMTFGRWNTSDTNLFWFINDRNDLRGARRPGKKDEVWWQEMHSLIVSKTVDSELLADRNTEFNFTVKLHDAVTDDVLDISETFGTGKTKMVFEQGVASFALKNGESKIALYVPGTIADQVANCRYEVEEEDNPNFTTVVDNTETEIKQGTFNEMEGEVKVLVHRADFTNTRKTGDLTVSKVVFSDQATDKDQEFNFRVTLSANEIKGTYGDLTFSNGTATFTLKDGESKTAAGLPTGITYTVTETPNNSFNTTTTVNDEEKAPTNIELVAGDNNVVFTNTRKVGGLKLVKNVSSDAAADKDIEFPITVTLTQNGTPVNAVYPAKDKDGQQIQGGAEFDGNGKHTFMLKDGEFVTIEGLPQGVVYNVTESVTGFTPRYVYTDANGRTDNSRAIGTDITTCTITNTRATGRLQINKALVSDRSADSTSAQFSFIVKLGNTVTDPETGEARFVPDATINKTYSSVAFTNGVSAPFTITGASSKTFTGLPQGIKYEVTELEKDKFTLTMVDGDATKTTSTGTVGSTTSIATFTNTRATGDLKIQKTVFSDAAADLERSFTFTVRLGDSRISKRYTLLDENGNVVPGGINFSGGVATGLSMKHGESRTIVGLPTDVTYTVTETTVSGFTTAYSNATGTIVENRMVTDESTQEETEVPGSVATVTNTRNVGNLTVRKTVSSDLLNGTTVKDSEKEFTFTVQLGSLNAQNQFVVDETIGTEEEPKTYGGMTFIEGVATFHLKHGGEIVATGIPGDMRYLVTETPDADFNTTFTGASGSISPTRWAVASFTNTRKTGRLTISKTVVSDVTSDRSQNYSFTVKLGNTVVNEQGEPEFVTDTTLDKRYGSVTFADGEATVTLRPSTGTASTTISGLPQGIEYEVTENNTPIEYMTTTVGDTKTNTAVGIISAASNSTAAFTNTRNKGNLTVTKVLVSDLAADKDVEFDFTVKLGTVNQTYSGVIFTNGTGTFKLKGGESKTLEGLPEGLSYTVTETANSNFNTTKTGDKGSIVAAEITDEETGETALVFPEAVFTNTRKTGDLRLTKRVVSDMAGDAEKEFTFTVTLADETIGAAETVDDASDDDDSEEEAAIGKKYGDLTFVNGVATVKLKKDQSATAVGLPITLQYTITEEAVEGFTTSKNNDTGSIKTDRTDAVFTNTRDTGNLTVKKVLSSDLAVDANLDFSFTVMLGSKDNEGTFTVDESIGAVTDATPNGKTFGDMTFKNGVAVFTLKGGQSRTAIGLPAGIAYTVEETAIDAFDVAKENETGTIPVQDATNVTFTNTRKKGTLRITKDVDSDLATDKTVGFKFTLTLTGLSELARNKTYSDVQFRNGSATVTLKDGEIKEIEGLPTGVGYSVKESLTTAQTADYTVDPETLTRNGVIGAEVSTEDVSDTDEETGEEITEIKTFNLAAFTNTRVKGDLAITKTVVSDLAADKTVEFKFTVTLSDTSIGATTEEDQTGKSYASILESGEGDDKVMTEGTVTFIDGVAEVSVKHGEKLTIKDLPTDVKATVVEVLDADQKADYTTTPTNLTRTATISSTPYTAVFTNTRKTGKLTIRKTLVSAVTDDKSEEFSMIIRLGSVVNQTIETDDESSEPEEIETFMVDETQNKTYSNVTFANGEATITLKGGESKTIEGLPTDLVYVVEENLTEEQKEDFITEPDPAKVQGIISSTAVSVANIKNTRKTGDLMIGKKVENGFAVDSGRKFNFTLELGTKDEDGNFTVDENISGSYGDVTFRKGVSTFTLTDGAAKIIENVPIGMTYVVRETTVSGFIPVQVQTGTILENTTMIDEVTGDSVSAPGRKVEVTNTRAVCKITGHDGMLLYYKDENGVIWPAAYSSLENAFEALKAQTFYTNAEAGTSYEAGSAYHVEMLVDEYALPTGVAVPEGMTLTLTTAETGDMDGFPYTGATGTASTISRSANYGSMIASKGELTLVKIILDGAKDEYTGNGDGGIMNASAGSLNIQTGATLRNSVTTGNGGAVYVANGVTLTMNGATVTGNQAEKGGGVYARGHNSQASTDVTVTIVGGEISNNTATGEGGGLFIHEGRRASISGHAILSGNTTLATTSVAVDNDGNRGDAHNGVGGAIYVDRYAVLNVENSTISGNDAYRAGGGVYVYASNYRLGELTLSNVQVKDNKAGCGGGIGGIQMCHIYIKDGTVISGNQAIVRSNATAGSATIYHNGCGGGIGLQSFNWTHASAENSRSILNVIGGSIEGNTAGASGGGVYVNSGTPYTIIDGTEIKGNTAVTGGGGYAGSITLRNGVTVTENKVSGTDVTKGAGFYVTGKLTLGQAGAEEETTTISGNTTTQEMPKDSNLCLSYTGSTATTVAHNGSENVELLCPFTGKLWVSNPGEAYTQFGISGDRSFLPDPANVDTASMLALVESARIASDDETELIGRMEPGVAGSTKIFWWKRPVCKITDGAGVLLYTRSGEDLLPAVYAKLCVATYNPYVAPIDPSAAFSMLNNANPGFVYADGSSYTGADYCVKMLDDYIIRNQMYLDTGNKGIVFTTATKSESDGYSYVGTNKSEETGDYAAIIDRGRSVETSTQAGNPYFMRLLGTSNVTLKNITMGGNANVGIVVPIDGPFVNLFGQAKLYIEAGTTLQNSRANDSNRWGGGAICQGYGSAGTYVEMNGGVIQNCYTTKNGGAISSHTSGTVVINGGTIQNCGADLNGGAIYMEQNSCKLIVRGGTIRDCSASHGGGIYLNDGAPLEIGTTVENGVRVGGQMVFSGNYGSNYTSYNGKLNGEGDKDHAYTYSEGKAPQDIFVAKLTGDPAQSIKLIGDIQTWPDSETDEEAIKAYRGGIWLWAEPSDSNGHYRNKEQFAVFADGLITTDSSGKLVSAMPLTTAERAECGGDEKKITELKEAKLKETLRAFRNALDDGTTKNDTGYYLTGYQANTTKGQPVKYIYWGPAVDGFNIVFRKIDGFGKALNGAQFTLYTDVECTNANVLGDPMTSGTIEADNAVSIMIGSGDSATEKAVSGSGLVVFEKVPEGEYYMKETTIPKVDDQPYAVTAEKYQVVVNSNGSFVIKAPGTTEGSWVELTKQTLGSGADAFQLHAVLNLSPVTRKIMLRKVEKKPDDDNKWIPLQGAQFQLLDYDLTLHDFGKDKDGADNAEKYINFAEGTNHSDRIMASDSEGVFFIGRLPLGVYYLKETTPPTGYTLPAEGRYYRLEVPETGTVTMSADPVEPGTGD